MPTAETFTLPVFGAQEPVVSSGPWRILYGPPQPGGGYDGRVRQPDNFTVTLRAEPDAQSEVSFSLDCNVPESAADAARITELVTDITIGYNNAIVFQGRTGPSGDDLDANTEQVTFTAYDYREVLRRRAILPGDQVSWPATDPAVIAWQMIQHAQGNTGGNLGIVQGSIQSTGQDPFSYTCAVGDYVGDKITELAQMGAVGWEWQITPYGDADLRFDVFIPDQGEDNGRVLAWGDTRITGIHREVNPDEYANAVLLTGDSGTQGLTPVLAEASDLAARPEGRWDKVTGTELKTQGSIAAAAAGQLARAELIQPSYTITLAPGSWGGPSDMWLGDMITLWCQAGRLDVAGEKLRIVEMAFTIDASNQETLTLTLGARPYRLAKKIPAIARRLSSLETR